MTSKRILFFGNEKLATGVTTSAPILSGLIKSGYEIVAVIVAQTHDIDDLEVAKLAKQHNIQVISFSNLKDQANLDEIANFKVEAAVLAAYGKIIPEAVLNIFAKGIINVHPSLLPKHRGPSPIESTILQGDKETGVSLIRLVKAMDAGPIYKQESFPLSANESKQDLVDKLGALGSQMLSDNLEAILSGQIEPYHQDESRATYDKLITKSDGQINWEDSYEKLYRQIRAYAKWPGIRTKLKDIDITVLAAHSINETGRPGQLVKKDNELGIFCSDGLVVLDELQPAGKKPMSGKDFLLGYSRILF